MRKAFADTMKDVAYMGEFTKLMGEAPSPTNGEDMQKLLADIDATPAPVIARLKEILKPSGK